MNPATPSNAVRTSPAEEYRQSTRVTVVGGIYDLVLGVAKIIVGVIGGSQALIADGVHSLSDLATDFLVVFATRHSTRDADVEHPYGHGRIQTLASVILAVTLIVVAAGIGWESIQRVLDPAARTHPGFLVLMVAALSAIIKEAIFHYTMRTAERLGSNLLRANAWHSRSDALSSIVVMIGVGGSMLGVDWSDAAAAVVVALMIAKVGYDIGREGVDELIDTAVDPDKVERMREVILETDGVRDAHELRTRRMGSRFLADVHIRVSPTISVSEGHRIGDAVVFRLRKAFHDLDNVTVHVDPEDDERRAPSSHLPMRQDILDTVAAALERSAAEEGVRLPAPDHIVLHYLRGRIQVDLWLPMSGDREQARRLTRLVEEALAPIEQIDRVHVLFHARPADAGDDGADRGEVPAGPASGRSMI